MYRQVSLYQRIKEEKLLTALVVVFWLFLFLATASKNYSYVVRNDMRVGADYIFLEAFLIWGIAALFAPVFIWLAKKYPIGESTYRNIIVHIGLCFLLMPVHALFFELIMFPCHNLLVNVAADKRPWTGAAFLKSYLGAINWFGIVSLLSYWLVVGACYLKNHYELFRERQLRNMKLEAELASIRLQVLKVQLHPHFLFNTLHNVHALLREEPAIADEVLKLLRRFLQLSIQRVDDQKVPLQDELEFTGTYLEIEKTRFSNRLTIEKNIEPSTLQAEVPSFMLQPLVENAVRHGISKKMKPGVVRITSKKTGAFLHLTVEDDGPGINGTTNRGGLGLKNTNQRLNQLYEDAVLELSSSTLGGLKVKIVIPFEV